MDPRLVIIEFVAVWLLTWGLVPHVLTQRQKTPVAVMAWVFSIFLLPVLGGVFYLLFGWDRMHRRRLRRIGALKAIVSHPECGDPELTGTDTASASKSPRSCVELSSLHEALPELRRINESNSTGGNHVVLLDTGEAFFEYLIQNIRLAQHHIHLEFYIWATDATGKKIRDELTAAARRGVEVRLLLDEIGSFTTRRRFFRDLETAGGKFAWFGTFAPLRGSLHLNFRNHRKLVIFDGKLALTGGMNIGDEYWHGSGKEKAYRDLQLSLRGPAMAELIWQFVQDWYFATGEALNGAPYLEKQAPVGSVSVQVVAGGPDTELNELQLSMLSLLQRSQKRVWMMTPYFVPEAPLISALVLAAMRGVEVRLIVPQRGDHGYLTAVTRSYYDQLLPHGVRIYEYRPGMLHAKVTLVDDLYSMAGSANLDVRSLRINFELNLVMACPDLNAQLVGIFERDFALSDRIRWGQFQNRPFRRKLAEVICRPLAPLL